MFKYIENNDYLLIITSKNDLIKVNSSVDFYNDLLVNLTKFETEEELLEFAKQGLVGYNIPNDYIIEALQAKQLNIYKDGIVINGEFIKRNNTENSVDDSILHILNAFIDTNKAITNFEHLKPFIVNINKNTFIKDKKELAKYLLNDDYEITKDGYLLAYKSIRDDYTSHYDEKTLHKVGTVVEVKDYDSNSNNLCSKGLHFATKSYIKYMYGYDNEIIVLVKIHPEDIIAIPKEADNTKGRCRKYEVVEIFSLDKELKETTTQTITEEVKTKKVKDKIKKVNKPIQDKKETRTEQTKRLMKEYNGNKEKVAEIMGISISTVERNMRRK